MTDGQKKKWTHDHEFCIGQRDNFERHAQTKEFQYIIKKFYKSHNFQSFYPSHAKTILNYSNSSLINEITREKPEIAFNNDGEGIKNIITDGNKNYKATRGDETKYLCPRECRVCDNPLTTKDQLIQQKDQLIQQKHQLIQQKDQLLQQKHQLLQQKHQLIQQKTNYYNKNTNYYNKTPLSSIKNLKAPNIPNFEKVEKVMLHKETGKR